MNIFKKIALGALILLAGVIVMPEKAWAAAEELSITVDSTSTNGTISYSTTNCKDSSNKLVIKVTVNGNDHNLINTSIGSDELSDSYDALEKLDNLLGRIDSQTNFTVSGDVYDSDNKSIASASDSGTVYVGKIVPASGTTKVMYSGSALSNITLRTLNPEEEFTPVTVSADAPFYIKRVGSSDNIDQLNTEINSTLLGTSKISEMGRVQVEQGKMTAAFSSPFNVTTATAVSPTITISPSINDLYYKGIIDMSLNPSSTCSTYSHGIPDGGFDDTNKTVTLNTTCSPSGSTVISSAASIKLYASTNSNVPTDDDYLIGTLSYSVNYQSGTPTPTPSGTISISGDEYILAPANGTTTASYTATLKGFPSGTNPDWSLAASPTPPSSASVSGSNTTGTLTYGTATGTLKIVAKVEDISAEKTVKVVNMGKPTITGPSSMIANKNNTATATATVKYDTEETVLPKHDGVTWLFENDTTLLEDNSSPKKTIATINATTGLITLGEGATAGTSFKIKATTKATPSKTSDLYTVQLTEVIPVTGLSFKTTAVTKGYVLDMGLGKNVSVVPSNAQAGVSYIEWSLLPNNMAEMTGDYKYDPSHNAGLKGINGGTVKLTPTIHYVGSSTTTTLSDVYTFDVYNPVVVFSSSSDDAITFTLPDKVYTSYSGETNISKVKGYRIDVLNSSDKSLYNSTTTISDSASRTITLSSDQVENLVESASGDLSGDTAEVRFKISPVGTSQTTGNNVTNNEAGAVSEKKTAYKVSVSGSNIKSASIYGLANHSVKITATPTSSTYKFAGWSDGNTSNPRTVTVSTNTSSNSYTASANTTGTPSSTAGNNSSKGSNSKLDKVPKTGESMAIYFIVMIAVISGCVAFATLFKSLTAKAAKSEFESSIDSWRGGEDGTGESHKK